MGGYFGLFSLSENIKNNFKDNFWRKRNKFISLGLISVCCLCYSWGGRSNTCEASF